jgi:hypothetical protein
MTYIYIATHEDHASIVTDSWAYSSHATTMGISDKVRMFPHRRLAITASGDLQFTARWSGLIQVLSERTATLDLLNDVAPEMLARLWEAERQSRDGERIAETMVLHVGYSDRAGRFTTTAFTSRHGFRAEPVDGAFVHPTPAGYKVAAHELESLTETLEGRTDPAFAQVDAANLAAMRDGALEVPTLDSDGGLASFAAFVRENRTMISARSLLKVLVGGTLYATTITKDAALTARIFDFDDSDETLAEIFSGTLHPIRQLGACDECGSGRRWIDCHGAQMLDRDCLCGSGRTFGRCCAVSTADESVRAAVS